MASPCITPAPAISAWGCICNDCTKDSAFQHHSRCSNDLNYRQLRNRDHFETIAISPSMCETHDTHQVQ